MHIKIGEIEALYRYPVKSMSGELLETADLGWHGLDGDRRLALRRIGDRSGFPWLTASKVPELILYAPQRRGADESGLPTHVRTPEGRDLDLFGDELAADIARRHGAPVEMTHLNRGIFDEASVSLITSTTVGAVANLAGHRADARRFRPNILIASAGRTPFEEDTWVEGVLTFGDDGGPAIGITNRDERCAMVNYDPDGGHGDPEVLKSIVRERDNKAGVYGATTRRGRLAVGQAVFFHPAPAHRGE